MAAAWDDLPKDCQLSMAEGALQHACAILAQQAESLAEEIERGEIEDRGGADALRLLARLVRLAHLQGQTVAGRA
jgi:hypothetical protein